MMLSLQLAAARTAGGLQRARGVGGHVRRHSARAPRLVTGCSSDASVGPADWRAEVGDQIPLRTCPSCGTTMKNWRRHMARCCPDELNPESWGEDAPYIWGQVLELWGAQSLEARVMRARFGFDGAARLAPDAIGELVRLKPYRCSELVQQVLQRIPFVSDALPVHVLYEDEHLLALAKPPRTSVTPRNRSRGGAMLNRAVHHLSPKAADGGAQAGARAGGAPTALSPRPPTSAVQPYVVHRLDYNTSGVLLFAKTSMVANALAEQFRQPGRVAKAYLALVALQPAGAAAAAGGGWLNVDAPLGREDRSRQAVLADGKEASTWIRLAALGAPAAAGARAGLLVARPLTGRTHQIRVHATHAGAPLLGDDAYGVETDLLDRHALHAWRISLEHPATGERLRISAPLPDDLAAAMGALGLAMPDGLDAIADGLRVDEADLPRHAGR